MLRIGKLFLPIVCLFLLATARCPVLASDNLLTNGELQNFDGKNFPGWTKNVSTLGLAATGSGAILQSTSSSTKYLYQIIPATPSASYHFSAVSQLLSGSASAYLRATQCSTLSCTSSKEEIKSTDARDNLSLDFTTATNTVSLKLKLSLDPADSSASSLIFGQAFLGLTSPLAAPVSVFSIDFTPPATVSADSAFAVPIIITGAKGSTTYSLKVVGGPSSQSVSTQNGSDWLAWNASWSSFPTVTTDASGSATVTLFARFNSGTTPAGDNPIFIRLRLSDTNLDSSAQTVSVIAAVGSTTGTADPSIDLSFANKQTVGLSFAVSVTAANLPANTSFYSKARIGVADNALSDGATQNSGTWLSDTDTWSKFPTLTTDSTGKWQGTVWAKVKDGRTAGNYKIRIRLRNQSTGDNFDSGSKDLIALASSAINISTVSAVPGVNASSGAVLGSATVAAEPANAHYYSASPAALVAGIAMHHGEQDAPGTHLIALGLCLLGVTCLLIVRLPKTHKPDSVSQQSSIFARLP